MMKTVHSACLAILIAGLLSPGFPCAHDATAADQNPCASEMAAFCKDVKPGTPAMIECLEKHESMLSDACRAYEEKMGGRRTESREDVRQERMLRQACAAEIDKFCRNAGFGPGGMAACLNDHMNELSTPCGNSVKAVRGEQKNVK